MKTTTPRNKSLKNQKLCNKSHSPQMIAKVKNKQNIPLQHDHTDNVINKDQKQSIKICLQLAKHHQKQAQQLKIKNEVLQYRLREQTNDMQMLKKQLESIKMALNQNKNTQKKEIQKLKYENTLLKEQIQGLKHENNLLKSKVHQTQSIITMGDGKQSIIEINPLTLAKSSRRQKYALDYQSISFVPSTACISCKRKDDQISEQRQKYCNQLRQLQQQVSQLQRIQIIVGVMEQQLSDKNICIDFLRNQLDRFQFNTNKNLKIMCILQERLNDLASQNNRLKQTFMKHSSTRTVT